MSTIYRLLMAFGLLLCMGTAMAQYNPVNPGEPDAPTPPTPPAQYYSLSIASSHPGCCSLYGSGSKQEGANVRVYLSNIATGYTFLNWTDDDGNEVSSAKDFYYTMPSRDVTLTANFRYDFDPNSPGEPDIPSTPPANYRLSLTSSPSECCTLYGGGVKTEGDRVNVYLNRVLAGYKFINWTDEEENIVSTISDFYYTMPSRDVTLTANFSYTFAPADPAEPDYSAPKYTLTLVSNPPGWGTFNLNSTSQHSAGTSITLNATPASNRKFINWTDEAGNVVETVPSIFFTMPGANYILTANFEKDYNPTNPGEPDQADVENIIDPDKVYGPRILMMGEGMVGIVCETQNADIYYTTDGSEPSRDNPTAILYTDPFEVDENIMVRAIAYYDGMKDSQITQRRVNTFCCETPVISYGSARAIVMTCPTEGATIYYTNNYVDPDPTAGIGILYTGPFVPSGDTRFKAVAVKEGLGDSEISPFAYRIIELQAKTPTLVYDEESHTVTIDTDEEGVLIYVATDGSAPTEDLTPVAAPCTIRIDRNIYIKAFAASTDLYPSELVEWSIDSFSLSAPSIEYSNRKVVMTAEDGAYIRYTLDGTAPNADSPIYSEPLLLTSDCTVKAISCRDNYNNSDITTYQYRFAEHKISTPELSHSYGFLDISCATPDVTIYVASSQTINSNPVINTVFANIANSLYDGLEDMLPALEDCIYTEEIPILDNNIYFCFAYAPEMIPSNRTSHSVTDLVKYYVIGENVNGKLWELAAEDCRLMPLSNGEYIWNGDVLGKEFKINDGTWKFVDNYGSNGSELILDQEYTMATTVLGEYLNIEIADHDILFKPQIKFTPANTSIIVSELGNYNINIGIRSGMIVMEANDPDVEIRYTTNGAVPDTISTLYTEPFLPQWNCSIKAAAVYKNKYVFPPTSFSFYTATVQTVMPSFTRENNTLSISCISENNTIYVASESALAADDDANAAFERIRNGNLNDLENTLAALESYIYSDPITLNRNDEFRTFAVSEAQFYPSAINRFTVDDFTASAPVIRYGKKEISISSNHENAVIYYTVDGSAPTEESNVYTEPFLPEQDCSISAIAFVDGWNISDASAFNFEVADFTLASPSIAFHTKNVNINTPGNEGALNQSTVYRLLSIDDDEILAEDVYTTPFLPEMDCIVESVAISDNFFDSAPVRFTYQRADYELPGFKYSADYKSGLIKIQLNGAMKEGENISVYYDEDVVAENRSIEIYVDHSGTIRAEWEAIDRLDLEPMVIDVIRAEAPEFKYDGRNVSIMTTGNIDYTAAYDNASPRSNSVSVEQSEYQYTFTAEYIGSVSATVWRDGEYISESSSIDLPYHHDGDRTVTLREADCLSKAFAWNPDIVSDVESLKIVNAKDNKGIFLTGAKLSPLDMKFLGSFSSLKDLDLSQTVPVTFISNALPPSLTLISLPYNGDFNAISLSGLKNLCAVFWNSTKEMSQTTYSSVENPNALFITSDYSLIPATDNHNVVVGSKAKSLKLRENFPFNTPADFTVERAEFVKTFTRETPIDSCSGWETIILPFDVKEIYHNADLIVPFADKSASGDIKKRFWLSRPSETGWSEADRILAGHPYIISMPNSPEYVREYNITGEISFIGLNAHVSTDDISVLTMTDSHGNQRHYSGSYMPVFADNNVFALSNGNTFIADTVDVAPFECFFDGPDGADRIRISKAVSDYFQPSVDLEDSLVYDIHGLVVGRSSEISKLSPGIYISNGKKILINR